MRQQIHTDSEGRRYAEKLDGTRIYLPAAGKVDAEQARRNREAIEAYHQMYGSTLDTEDD